MVGHLERGKDPIGHYVLAWSATTTAIYITLRTSYPMPKLPRFDLTYHFRLLTDVRVGDVLPSSDHKLLFAELILPNFN